MPYVRIIDTITGATLIEGEANDTSVVTQVAAADAANPDRHPVQLIIVQNGVTLVDELFAP